MRNAVTHCQSRILANPALAEIAAGYSPNEAETAAGYHAGQSRRDENAARVKSVLPMLCP